MIALGEHVIVRPAAVKTRTPGGIILPDSAQAKSGTGEVVSIGGWSDGPLKKGDTVSFAQNRGVTIAADGEEFLALKEGDLLAIL
jgi:chaperonin GroES